MSLNTIAHRVSNQLSRITEGVQSGSLSASQATTLARKDLKIVQQATAEAAQNGGKLTAPERQQLRQELNHNSRDIFEEKHPRSVPARLERQADRIAEGVKSGKLTPDQAKALAQADKQIAQEARADRKANGGKLTTEQRATLEKELNQSSRAIYQAKHPSVTPLPPVTQVPPNVGEA